MNAFTKRALPLMVILGLTTNAGATVRVPLYEGPEDTTWQTLTIPGVNATEFRISSDGSLIADCMAAFGMIVRELDGVKDYPVLSWRWRIDRKPPATDLSRKGGDDRPIALHVWFPQEDKDTSIWTSIGDTLANFIGLPPNGRVITYMWGGKHSTGESFTNPYLPGRGKIVIMRGIDAPVSKWMSEQIDIAADYRRLFGAKAPAPSHIAISADTDDTGVKSRAAIADIRFTSVP